MAEGSVPTVEMQSVTIIDDAEEPLGDVNQHRTSGGYLTPRSRSPNTFTAHGDTLQFFGDDSDQEYEWIRVPRHRDFEVVAVPSNESGNRGTAHVPLIAIANHAQQKVVMWAKMDTGADANVIHLSTLHELLGDETESRMSLMRGQDFNLIGSKKIRATHFVELDFWTGRSKTLFEKIPFVVVQDNPNLSNQDGVPNCILGWPTLQKEKMVMIDVEYVLEADPELQVISKRSEQEATGLHTLGPLIMLPNTKGFARPPKR